mgnify:CR=1 FL=1
MVDLDLLAGSELCAGLAGGELERLGELAEKGSAAQGQRIHQENQEAEELFLLTHGRVELRFGLPGRGDGRDTTVSVVRPGGFFGWSALVPPHRYTLTAVCAAAPCRFYRLRRGPTLGLFRVQPLIGYRVMRNLAGIMGRRFRSLQEELVREVGQEVMHGW